jgi:SAM-dependent methyltransferase
VVADFNRPGLEGGCADLVFTDAAFHHAPEPVELARTAWELLRPGGRLVLFREPTLTPLRRTRDHGEEGLHGSFEREYDSAGYLEALTRAGFAASRHRAAGGFRGLRRRALLAPPLAWLNGLAFAEFTYVGVKP